MENTNTNNANDAYNTDEELMAGFELADGRTGADFRAMRERIGWSQNEVGTALNVNPNTVKKWENPLAGWEVRPYGWSWIDRMYEAYWREVDQMIDYAVKEVESQGIPKGGEVRISYYRNGPASSGVARTRHGEPAGAADAVSRAVGEYFESEGYRVRYVWAENGGWII